MSIIFFKSIRIILFIVADTIFAFTKNEFHIIAGSKKLDILKQLGDTCKEEGIYMHFYEKPKKDTGKVQMDQLLEVIKKTADPPVIGTLQAC